MRDVRRYVGMLSAAAGLWFAYLTFTVPLIAATAPALLMIGCWFLAWRLWLRTGSPETGMREYFDRLFEERE